MLKFAVLCAVLAAVAANPGLLSNSYGPPGYAGNYGDGGYINQGYGNLRGHNNYYPGATSYSYRIDHPSPHRIVPYSSPAPAFSGYNNGLYHGGLGLGYGGLNYGGVNHYNPYSGYGNGKGYGSGYGYGLGNGYGYGHGYRNGW